MRLTLAAVADYASISIEQKLSVMGVFDTLWGQAFPLAHPQMFLVLRVQFSYEDSGKDRKLKVRLENADGKRLFQGEMGGPVPAIPPGERPNANLVMQVVNTVFQSPGTYTFVVEDGGEELQRIPLKVAQLPDANLRA